MKSTTKPIIGPTGSKRRCAAFSRYWTKRQAVHDRAGSRRRRRGSGAARGEKHPTRAYRLPIPLGYGSDHHREVAWILGEEEDQPISDRLPYEPREKVAPALVEKIVRCIQTQTVQVILREPAKCVLEEEGAHLVTLFAIEIGRRPPESLVAIREIKGG